MKVKKYYPLIFLGIVFLWGCATTMHQNKKNIHDAEYEKGLKYSTWLYSKPIDILKKDSIDVPAGTQNDSVKLNDEKRISEETKTNRFSVQVASFHNKKYAERYLKEVRVNNPVYQFGLRYSTGLWRIIVGHYTTRREAEVIRNELRKHGFPDAWIVQF